MAGGFRRAVDRASPGADFGDQASHGRARSWTKAVLGSNRRFEADGGHSVDMTWWRRQESRVSSRQSESIRLQIALEHRTEKCAPVFRKSDATTKL